MDRQQTNFYDDFDDQYSRGNIHNGTNGELHEPKNVTYKGKRAPGNPIVRQNGNRPPPANEDDREIDRGGRRRPNGAGNSVANGGSDLAFSGRPVAKSDGGSRTAVSDINSFSAGYFADKSNLSEREFLELPVEEVIQLFEVGDSGGKKNPSFGKAKAHAAVAWLFHGKDRLQHTRAILNAVRLKDVVPDTRRAIRQNETLMTAYHDGTEDGVSGHENGASGRDGVDKGSGDGQRRGANSGRQNKRSGRSQDTLPAQLAQKVAANPATNNQIAYYHGNKPTSLMQDVRLMLNSLTSKTFNVIQERFKNFEIVSSKELGAIVAELVKNAISRPGSATLYAELTKTLASGNDLVGDGEDAEGSEDQGEDEHESKHVVRSAFIEQKLMALFSEEIKTLFDEGLGGTVSAVIAEGDVAEKSYNEARLHRRYLFIIRFVGELYLVGLTGVDIVTDLMIMLLPKAETDYTSERKCSPKIQRELEALCMLVMRVGNRVTSEDKKDLNGESYRILDAFRDIIAKKAASNNLCETMQSILDENRVLSKRDDEATVSEPKKPEEKNDGVLPSKSNAAPARGTVSKKPVRRAVAETASRPAISRDRPVRPEYRPTAAPWRPVSERPPNNKNTEIAKKFTTLRVLLNKLVPSNVAALTKEFSNLNLCFKDEVLSAANALENRMRRDVIYSPLYAKMLRTLLAVRPSTSDGGKKVDANGVASEARKQLLQTLQLEFEDKIASVGGFVRWTPVRRNLQLFWPGSEYFQWKAQRARLTTMRLIGELFVQKIVPRAIIVHCIQQLMPKNHADLQFFRLSPRAQVKLDCLCMLLMTICMRLLDDTKTTAELLESQPVNLLQQFKAMVATEKRIMPARLRYRVQDVIDIATVPPKFDGLVEKIERGSGDAAPQSSADSRLACFADVYFEYHRRRVESKLPAEQPLSAAKEEKVDEENMHGENVESELPAEQPLLEVKIGEEIVQDEHSESLKVESSELPAEQPLLEAKEEKVDEEIAQNGHSESVV